MDSDETRSLADEIESVIDATVQQRAKAAVEERAQAEVQAYAADVLDGMVTELVDNHDRIPEFDGAHEAEGGPCERAPLFYDFQTRRDDEAATHGYATGQRYYSSDGQLISSVAADGVHNHWSVYTRNQSLGPDFDLSPMNKRVAVDAGSDDTTVRFSSYDGTNRVISHGSDEATFQFITEGGNLAHWSAVEKHESVYLTNLRYDGDADGLSIACKIEMANGNLWDFYNNPVAPFREVANAEHADLKDGEAALDTEREELLVRERDGSCTLRFEADGKLTGET